MSHTVQVITSGKSLQAVPVYPGSNVPVVIQGTVGPSGARGGAGPSGATGPAAPIQHTALRSRKLFSDVLTVLILP